MLFVHISWLRLGIMIESEKRLSLSEATRTIIEKDPYIKNTLADGLINYSALARRISTPLEKKLGRKINEESLIVAIKRYADEIQGRTNKNNYSDLLARSTLSMQDDMCCAVLTNNEDVIKTIMKHMHEDGDNNDDSRIIVQNTGRVTLVLKKHKIENLLEKLKDEVLDTTHDCALITMKEPLDSKNTHGIIAELSSLLSKKGISIELFSSPQDIHFLVNEDKAEEAYRALKDAIKSARVKED